MKFKIYQDKAGLFRWTLVSGRHVRADSGEGYSKRSNARKAARTLHYALAHSAVEIVDV
jgi:uncharacterized protein YegP (UPF0339 family)